MKTNKNKILYFVIIGLLLVIVNLVSFLYPFTKTVNFWVGYSFTTLSFIISAIVLLLQYDKKDEKSRFYGVSVIFVLEVYVAVQFVLSLLQMRYNFFHYRFSILINAVLLILAVIGLITLSMGNNNEEEKNKEIE